MFINKLMNKKDKTRYFSIKLFVVYAALESLDSAHAAVVTYQVKKGDTLSKILKDHGLKPLHGKKGFINLTTKLNENKIKENGNFVLIGEMIVLPVKEVFEESITIKETPSDSSSEIETKTRSESRPLGEELPYSHFIYSPHLSFLRIDATNDVNLGGSNVTALSERGFGIDLEWHVFYNERISFFGFGSLEHFSFYKDPNYSFNNSTITRLHYGVGGKLQYLPELKITSSISIREVSFLNIMTPVSINLESIPVAEIVTGFEKTMFTKSQLTGVFGAHVSGVLPGRRGSYKSNLGFGIGAMTVVTHKTKSLYLTYNLRSLQVNEIKDKESLIVLGMSFLGEND